MMRECPLVHLLTKAKHSLYRCGNVKYIHIKMEYLTAGICAHQINRKPSPDGKSIEMSSAR